MIERINDATAGLPADAGEGEAVGGAAAPAYACPREFRKSGRLTDEQRALVEANLGLVWEVAHTRFRGWLTPEERADYGLAGLVDAAMDFDAAKGCQFSTYAWMKIVRKIQRARFGGYDLLIGTPVRKGGRDEIRVFQEGGYRPTLASLPGGSGPSAVDVERFWAAIREAIESAPRTAPRDAEMFELRHRYGWPVHRLAERYGVDRHTVAYAMRRHMARLARLNPKGLHDSIVEIV